ncbi:MAG: transposase [Anaerolineae bacterium]|nr:transposase [Anaerolineae bacterium]
MSQLLDPDRYHRHSTRLEGYDYSNKGAYFMTICTHLREELFGSISDGTVQLTEIGQLVFDCWLTLPDHHPVELDEFIVMPNHFHAILVITNHVGAGRASLSSSYIPFPRAQPDTTILRNAPSGTLGSIIGSFKSVATKQINRLRNTPGFPVWQRSFYEHIIRDEIALNRIRQYIIDNPTNWDTDSENPAQAPKST